MNWRRKPIYLGNIHCRRSDSNVFQPGDKSENTGLYSVFRISATMTTTHIQTSTRKRQASKRKNRNQFWAAETNPEPVRSYRNIAASQSVQIKSRTYSQTMRIHSNTICMNRQKYACLWRLGAADLSYSSWISSTSCTWDADGSSYYRENRYSQLPSGVHRDSEERTECIGCDSFVDFFALRRYLHHQHMECAMILIFHSWAKNSQFQSLLSMKSPALGESIRLKFSWRGCLRGSSLDGSKIEWDHSSR